MFASIGLYFCIFIFILFDLMSHASVPFKSVGCRFNNKNWIFMREYLCLRIVAQHIRVHTRSFWWEIFPFSLEFIIYNIWLSDKNFFGGIIIIDV